MCSPSLGARRRRGALLGAALLVGFVSVGCSRPKGELFEPYASPRVWPAAPDAARIRYVGQIGGSDDLNAGRSAREGLLAALRGPRPPIRFSAPCAVATGPGELVAVADTGSVHVLDLAGRTHVAIFGDGEVPLGSPVGVAWAGRRLFVSDARRHEVLEFDAGGGFVRSFGAGDLSRPVGIAYVAAREALYVVDGGAHRVAVFSLRGELVRTFGGPGGGPGEFNFPTHVGCSGQRLLIADSGNFRVQLMDLEGRCLRSIGKKGNGAGDFSLPKGVAFDADGHLYVVDAHFENVQLFDQEGRLLMAFGEEGREAGAFWLPAGVAIDARDRIWVADAGNRRLQVFQYIRTAS